jgi:hypothetical protein
VTPSELAQRAPRIASGAPILNKFNQTPMDFDTFDTDLWSEIQDSDDEIFDIPEDFDRTKYMEVDDIDNSFIQMLNSTYTL